MSARTPLLVGLVIAAAALTTTYFVTKSSEDQFSAQKTYSLFADFKDAAGIRWKTRVQISGIDVGKIEAVRHTRNAEGRLVARVELRILKEYEVFEDAQLRKMAESLLGDYRLDLDPGTPGHRKLEAGEVIPNVQSLSDLDAIQSELRQVAVNVNKVTDSLSSVLAGPEGEGSLRQILQSVERSMMAIEQTTATLRDTVEANDTIVNQMISDLGKFTNTLAAMSGEHGELREITGNLAQLADRLNQFAGSLSGAGKADPGQVSQLRETLDNLNKTLTNMASVTGKIDQGEGTLGRVVNDSDLIDNAEETVENVNSLIGGIAKLETQIELRAEYAVPFDRNSEVEKGVKNTLGVRIIPKPDKYYLIEAVSDTRGVQNTQKTAREKDTNGDGALDSKEVENRVVTDYDGLKFSAQLAKRYYFLTLRFGIIENTGGIGSDLHLLDDHLELKFDAFDFTRRKLEDPDDLVNPRFRTTALFEFYQHLHLQAGIDDPFNERSRTWFLGGVLRFTDEDLKSLLTVAPTP